jgi:hypothetical protein
MKPETFIPIENSFKRIIDNLWTKAVSKAWPEINTALEKDDVTEAVNLIASIDVDIELSKRKEKQLRLLMQTALNYGAAVSVDDLSQSIFIREQPEELDMVMEMFLTSARENMRRFAAKGASLAAQKQIKDAQALRDAGQVQKGDIDPGKIEDMVLNNGRAISSIGANQTTSRLAAFGALSQLDAKGIVSYRLQAILDKRTSKICRRLNGKMFTVSVGLDHIRSVVRMTNPDDLRSADPWVPSNADALKFIEAADSQELIGNKWHVPPFHPHCRTIVVNADIDVPEAFLEEMPIAETATAKMNRMTVHKADHLARIDPVKFRDFFESQASVKDLPDGLSKLGWNKGRLATLRKVKGPMDEYPILGALEDGTVGIIDGRHRIALAAERDQWIKVAIDKDSLKHMRKNKVKFIRSVEKPDVSDQVAAYEGLLEEVQAPAVVPPRKSSVELLAKAKLEFTDELMETNLIEEVIEKNSPRYRELKNGNLLAQSNDPVEYMFLVDEDGTFIGANKGTDVSVGLSKEQVKYINTKKPKRSVSLHHNHPLDEAPFALSGPDIDLLIRQPWVKEVIAHIDETTSVIAKWHPRMDEAWFKVWHNDLMAKLWRDKPPAWQTLYSMAKKAGVNTGSKLQAEAVLQWAYNQALKDVAGIDVRMYGQRYINFFREHSEFALGAREAIVKIGQEILDDMKVVLKSAKKDTVRVKAGVPLIVEEHGKFAKSLKTKSGIPKNTYNPFK